MKRGIIIPKHNSEKLAEFIGILAGDGYVNFKKDHDYTVSITGHMVDDEEYHIKHILPLFKSLFGLDPKIIIATNKNARYVRVRSRTIVNFIKKQGFYKYKTKISIPKWIFREERYTNKFLRGLVDTDGSISLKKRYRLIPYYPVISITVKNEKLIRRIAIYLKKKGFSLWYGLSRGYDKRFGRYSFVYKVQLSGLKNLSLWNSTISFLNPKHIHKYKYAININGLEGI